MSFVLRKISAGGGSAMADEATAAALALAAVNDSIQYGDYLEWADPDANNGMGDDRWTSDIDKAKKFATFADATACWQAQSAVNPIRPDGKPNRPLTAWSVCVERA